MKQLTNSNTNILTVARSIGFTATATNTMADSLLGLCGDDWVILASDSTCARSVLVLKGDEDKIFPLDNNKILGCQGEDSDRSQFCEYVQKNITLHTLRTGMP